MKIEKMEIQDGKFLDTGMSVYRNGRVSTGRDTRQKKCKSQRCENLTVRLSVQIFLTDALGQHCDLNLTNKFNL